MTDYLKFKDQHKLPKSIVDAIKAFAEHIAQQDHGWGESVDKAEQDWEKKREALLKWWKDIKEKLK